MPDNRRRPVTFRCCCARSIEHLAPHDGGVYIDGTFGAGGYAAAILGGADVRVIGIDRDPDGDRGRPVRRPRRPAAA